MEVIQASSGYLSGTCNMTSYLPPEGRYSYYVIIFPGNVNVSATFHGNNTISKCPYDFFPLIEDKFVIYKFDKHFWFSRYAFFIPCTDFWNTRNNLY